MLSDMKILRLHHLAVIGSEIERSKEFYVTVLGCEVVAETYREERESWKVDLLLPDGVQIELFSFPNTPRRASRPEACGLRHMALEVDEIESWLKHLDTFGIEVEPIRVDELTGRSFTFFADPDGLPIELYEVKRGY
jgi:glyoxylase I family protein